MKLFNKKIKKIVKFKNIYALDVFKNSIKNITNNIKSKGLKKSIEFEIEGTNNFILKSIEKIGNTEFSLENEIKYLKALTICVLVLKEINNEID